MKDYAKPEDLSVHQALVAYRDALTAAGWKVVKIAEPSDAVLLAHFTKNGRDVWSSFHINGEDVIVRVADAGPLPILRSSSTSFAT